MGWNRHFKFQLFWDNLSATFLTLIGVAADQFLLFGVYRDHRLT